MRRIPPATGKYFTCKAPFMVVFYETYTGALTFENSHKGQEDDTPVKATTFKSPLYSYSDLLQ